jgi:alkaline phosphatase D
MAKPVNMKQLIFSILIKITFLTTFCEVSYAQHNLIKSGPMLGPVAMREAIIWVQTLDAANVRVSCRLTEKDAPWVVTQEVMTKADNAYIAHITLSMLEPGKSYEYEILVNGLKQKFDYPLQFRTQPLWQFRSDPPDFSFVTGSCFYVNDEAYDRPGKPYGGEYHILKHIQNEKADFMVWLGDNTYLREADFDSKSGIWYRQTHTRALPELQPVLAAMPHYAIWDDHDYGPNDSDWTYGLKNHTKAAFHAFWPNNAYGAGHTAGVTSSFVWGDCQFFMLDNRWYRSVDREYGTILGDQQKYWLMEALKSSPATYKFICVGGQFLSDAKVYENFANYAQEREEIIQFLDENNIKGVIFLTGDRHHSELTKLKTEKGNVFYDITSSALTSGTGMHNEANTLRVPDSMIGVRNYAVISVSGKRKERKVELKFKNSGGQIIYRYDLSNN